MTTRTKSILIYMGGIVTGIILTFVFFFLIALSKSDKDIVLFENPQQEIKAKLFEVIQVLPDGSALATVEDRSNFGMVVMFLADKGASYYDDQKIEVPSDKRVIQIGTYKYTTRNEIEKTVPIIEISDR